MWQKCDNNVKNYSIITCCYERIIMISESRIKRAAKNHAFGFETFFCTTFRAVGTEGKKGDNRPPPDFG